MPRHSEEPKLRAHDRIVRLRDGRALGYAEYGDPDGSPVINNHGGLSCRRDVEGADALARERGIRLISPDRPGIALSDIKVGRATGDWADDVEQLADQLDLQRFGCMGWSLGGQYALAVAWKLADRLTRTVVVAGAPPLTFDSPLYPALDKMDQRFLRLSHRTPAIARITFKSVSLLMGRFPKLSRRLTRGDFNDADLAALEREGGYLMEAGIAEACGTAGGMVEEYRAWLRPWGFKLEDIGSEVHILYGDGDTLCPPSYGEELARRIPGVTLHVLPGEGHVSAHLRYDLAFDLLLK